MNQPFVLSVIAALCLSGCSVRPLSTRPTDPLRDSPAGLEPVTLDSGLKYQDLRAGRGSVVPERDDQRGVLIDVRYEGRLADNRVFDRTGSSPRRFELDRLLSGWRLGLAGMREGGIRKLQIPAELGYQTAGNAAFGVPPDAELIYVIELVRLSGSSHMSSGVQDPGASDSIERAGSDPGQVLGKPHITRLGSEPASAAESPAK